MISGMNTYNSPAMFVGSRNDLVIYTFHMLDWRVGVNFDMFYCILGWSPERDLCDVLVSFFNNFHFKVLKISKVAGGPASDTTKHFLTDSHMLNL